MFCQCLSRFILKNSPFSFPSRRFSVSCTTFIKYGIHFKRTVDLRNAIIDMLLKAKIRTLKLQTRKQGRFALKSLIPIVKLK